MENDYHFQVDYQFTETALQKMHELAISGAFVSSIVDGTKTLGHLNFRRFQLLFLIDTRFHGLLEIVTMSGQCVICHVIG